MCVAHLGMCVAHRDVRSTLGMCVAHLGMCVAYRNVCSTLGMCVAHWKHTLLRSQQLGFDSRYPAKYCTYIK